MLPNLRFFAGLWTLRGYPSPNSEWSLAEKISEIRSRGFEGVGGRFSPELFELCERHNLDYIMYVDGDAADFDAQFREAAICPPRRINVQLCDHDTPPESAVRVWIEMARLAEELGLIIDLELHRDTATETPEKAYQIADLYRQATRRHIRFSLDFSHFAVAKHLAPPYAPRLLQRPELVSLARQMHLRPFNGHHAQVPATNGRGEMTPEFERYLEFVDELFGVWLNGKREAETLYACPENGPRPGGYALSCFPDVWEDAVFIRDRVREKWRKRLRPQDDPIIPAAGKNFELP